MYTEMGMVIVQAHYVVLGITRVDYPHTHVQGVKW